jgi:hypothetical protein
MAAVGNIEGVFPLSTERVEGEELFFLRVRGESLVPTSHERDYLLVRQQASVENGATAVALRVSVDPRCGERRHRVDESVLQPAIKASAAFNRGDRRDDVRLQGVRLQNCAAEHVQDGACRGGATMLECRCVFARAVASWSYVRLRSVAVFAESIGKPNLC